MRVAHFDCFNGISGDMVLGALIGVGVPLEVMRSAIDSLGLPIKLEIETVKTCGIAAIKATVHAEDQEDYRFLPDVEAILAKGNLRPKARELAGEIFLRIARAESTSHNIPLEKVHFHEVGALDSIADIVGAAVGLEWLGINAYTSSAVPTGSGSVKCSHGVMPIPAPATAELLKGVPLAAVAIKGELTTPTGAAILTALHPTFTDTPAMTIEQIGIGAGSKDFIDRPNILRILLGSSPTTVGTDTVVELQTNLDDCNPEILGYTAERLFAAGALDVYFTPIQMKKFRPGTLLTVLCTEVKRAELEAIIFAETGTFGVRRATKERTKRTRKIETRPTPWGPVAVKLGTIHNQTIVSVEYDDAVRLAKAHGVPLWEIYAAVGVPATSSPGAAESV
ncbi:MAG: nickel pincer cofactor biosynthesis protein LarC [Gemmataceae bacterium]